MMSEREKKVEAQDTVRANSFGKSTDSYLKRKVEKTSCVSVSGRAFLPFWARGGPPEVQKGVL